MKLALTLEGTVNAKFTAKRDLDRQDAVLHYEETAETGDVTVPRTITLRVPIFLGSEESEVTVRLGFRVGTGAGEAQAATAIAKAGRP